MKAVDLHDQQSVLRELTARLKPVLGNLEDYHESLKANDEVVPETPFAKFVVDSWLLPGGSRGYGLLKYAELD